MIPRSVPGGVGRPGVKARPTASKPNTIGLHQNALDALLTRMDGPPKPVPKRREFVRWPFRRESVPIRICHPGGSEVIIRLACRNISRGGMSVLHSAFVHVGSRCVLALPHIRKGPTPISGRIVRCEHRSGLVHELGIVFDQPINVRDFIPAESLEFRFSLERVPPGALQGTIIHLARSATERQLVRHALRDTSLGVRSVSTVEDLLAQVKLGCDLVLFELGGEIDEASRALEILTASAPHVRVVVIAPDNGDEWRTRAKELSAAVVVAKPLTAEAIVRVAAEFLLVDRQALDSAQVLHDEAAAAWVESLATALERAAASSDSDGAASAAHDVQTLAAESGWATLETVASKALSHFDAPERRVPVAEIIRDLSALCRQTPEAWI